MIAYSCEYEPCVNAIIRSLIQHPVHGIRSLGSSATNLAQIAEGSIDITYELGIHMWDIAAGILLVTEAGGVVEDFFSSSIDMRNRTMVAASHGNLITQFKEMVSHIFAHDDNMLVKALSQLKPDAFPEQ